MPDGDYTMTIVGSSSGESSASRSFHLTRMARFECESLQPVPPLPHGHFRGLCDFINFACGEHAVFADTVDADVHLQFHVLSRDTFQTTVWLIGGERFGIFDIGIDGKTLARTNAYDPAEIVHDSIGLGMLALDSGYH